MTQKEEQVIKLKSEIVLLKNKLGQYKQKLKDSVQTFETKKITEIQAQKEEEIQLKKLEIENYLDQIKKQTNIIDTFQSDLQEVRTKMQEDEDKFN